MSRFVKSESVVLTLSDGDTLTVRKRLNTGERRAMFDRMTIHADDGDVHVNRLQVGLTKVVAYLIDWNLKDDDGALVPIKGLAPDDVAAVLDALDPDDFDEVRDAIEHHEASMRAERERQKKTRAGSASDEAISPSPLEPVGASSGSES